MSIMKSSTRDLHGVTVVDLSGRITLGDGSIVLRELVRDLVRNGNNQIVLNLADVTYVDSSGMGELVQALTAARTAGGNLKLLKPSKHVDNLLRITNLCSILDIHNEEAAAVASFGSN